ncbi:MAG: MBOAT family O-acyltransferase [Thermodesulfovibrionia bacterium]|nr:MBOAT family O-acyltransferase [Thermodesulfovibrionia bacterium]
MASYAFYAAWDWRFLSLILTSTAIDYFCGIQIDSSLNIKRKKMFLLFSIIVNLSILGIFKYFNFFFYNLQALANILGFSFEPRFFNIILPVGISFYTFKTMTYTIGIYWEQIKPTRKFPEYALFVAFFPSLLSGPIDRADSLLPQILKPREITYDKFYKGSFLIFWGLFLKMFIADNMGSIVDPVYSTQAIYNGTEVLLSMYAYVFQLYCDFAGYSFIAIGLGKVMGFDMINNFNLPLFSSNVADFWRRWHISLSNWVRDYIYTPLFLSLRNIQGKMRLYVTLMITMFVLGLWHGAAWHFIIFGIYYGGHLVLYHVFQPRVAKIMKTGNPGLNIIWLIVSIVFMFHVTAVGFLLFRAESISQICSMLNSLIFNFRLADFSFITAGKIISFALLLLIVESIQFKKNDLMIVLQWNTLTRATFYFICFYLVIIFGVEGGKEFVYFQF